MSYWVAHTWLRSRHMLVQERVIVYECKHVCLLFWEGVCARAGSFLRFPGGVL